MTKQKGLPLRAFAIFLLAAVVGVAGGLLGSGFFHCNIFSSFHRCGIRS